MGIKKYSDAQILWLEVNGHTKVWKNRDEFRNTFNQIFGLKLDRYKFNNIIDYYKIKICTKQTESIFTEEQKQWLIENAKSGKYRNCKHLTDTYNAVFQDCRKSSNIIVYLAHWNTPLNSVYNQKRYTEEMDKWLRENYLSFETIEDCVRIFNKKFSVNKSVPALRSHCRKTLKLIRTTKKFYKGQIPVTAKNLYAISHRQDGDWIKVNMNNDKSSWIPIHKYIWEQNYGKVPKGYCVVFLNGDRQDVSLENLALLDRRGTATMSKFGWWTDNKVITKDAVQWCNLYCIAKDNGVYKKGEYYEN